MTVLRDYLNDVYIEYIKTYTSDTCKFAEDTCLSCEEAKDLLRVCRTIFANTQET